AAPATPPQAPAAQPAAAAQPAPALISSGEGSKFYSPLVLNIASKEGISMSELENIPGTGNEGRVTKKDILQYVADRKNGTAPAALQAAPAAAAAAPVAPAAPAASAPVAEAKSTGSYGSNVEIVEMDRMRKLIADHMVRSKATSPHVTS